MESRQKRVLVVEDEPKWQKLIHDLLKQAEQIVGCTINVVVAAHFQEALEEVSTMRCDCITIDNQLPDGMMARVLLDRISSRGERIPVVVISGAVDPDDVRDFLKDYDVAEFFWKRNFDPEQFRQTIAQLLKPLDEDTKQGNTRYKRKGGSHMDWQIIIDTAVSVLSPYVSALALGTATAAGTKLGEAVFRSIKGLWQWVDQTINESTDESAKQVFEDFKQDPKSNETALTDTIHRLSPDDNSVLRGHVEDLIAKVGSGGSTRLVSLLDDRQYYTFGDLKRICNRVSPDWEDDLGSNPSREELVRWVVQFAPTRGKEQYLVAAMLEINPTVLLR